MSDQNTVFPTFGIFNYASDELLQLDFTWLNIRILKLQSTGFKELINSISTKQSANDNHLLFHDMLSGGFEANPCLFAFIPIDFNTQIEEDTFYLIEKILLIMFPSNFKFEHIVIFKESAKGKYDWSSTDTFKGSSLADVELAPRTTDKYLLKFDLSHLNSINKFIRLAAQRLSKLDYINFAGTTYITSFSQESPEMRYVNLCMVLESLTSSTTELTHQIRRACAVLNADSKEQGMVIFNNVREFYGIRSKIVHGAKVGRSFSAIPSLICKHLFPGLYSN